MTFAGERRSKSDAVVAITLRVDEFSPDANRRRFEGETYRISFAGENPEGCAEEGEETKPELGPPNRLDCQGLAASARELCNKKDKRTGRAY